MSCRKRRFFGVDLVDEEGDDLSTTWSKERTSSGVLVFVGRRLMWRIVRSRDLRAFFRSDTRRVAPVDGSISRQIRVATGCRLDPFQEFQALVRLLSQSEGTDAAVYLLGRSTEGLQRVEQNLRATFPGLRIVGRAVFHPTSIAAVGTAIRKAAPRIVLSDVTSRSFFRWVTTSSDRIGPVLTIISPKGVGRMAGRRFGIDLIDVVTVPIRLFLPILLLGHRVWAVRKWKNAPG